MPAGHGRIPYVRARVAIENGDLGFLISHAKDLPNFRLGDALDICVLYVDQDIDSYEAAAIKWLMRFAREAKEVSLGDIQLAAGALDELPEQPEPAIEQLRALCEEHKLR